MTYPQMSAYERRAWNALLAQKSPRSDAWVGRVQTRISEAAQAADKTIRRVPGVDVIADGVGGALEGALNGAAKMTFMPAISSVSLDRRVARLARNQAGFASNPDFSSLDLKELDRHRPRVKLPFVGAATSAGASVAITGAEVSTTVTGGATAGVIVLAIAGDVIASLVLMGRAIAEVAVHYGYDPSEPEEEVYLMGVLSYSSAYSIQGKAAALGALANLTQRMMRQATWQQLQGDALVQVIQQVFTRIGIKLTHKRLAQVVPVLGGVISAGLSFQMLEKVTRDATRVYRARYLAEKHGLPFDQWVEHRREEDAVELRDNHPDDAGEAEIPIGVDEVLDQSLDTARALDESNQGPLEAR